MHLEERRLRAKNEALPEQPNRRVGSVLAYRIPNDFIFEAWCNGECGENSLFASIKRPKDLLRKEVIDRPRNHIVRQFERRGDRGGRSRPHLRPLPAAFCRSRTLRHRAGAARLPMRAVLAKRSTSECPSGAKAPRRSARRRATPQAGGSRQCQVPAARPTRS